MNGTVVGLSVFLFVLIFGLIKALKKGNGVISTRDGVFAVRKGEVHKVDHFTWGYEGFAPADEAGLVRHKDGSIELFEGPGREAYKNSGQLIDSGR